MTSKRGTLIKLFRDGFKLVPALYKRKAPVIKDWLHHWIKSEMKLNIILIKYPNSNFIIIPKDNWIVYDIDLRSGGFQSYLKLKEYFTPTFKVITGSGGFHYYYKLPPMFNKPLRKNLEDYPGIDIKTKTGGLVAPTSIHPNGGRYYIAPDSLDTIEDVPQELLKLAIKKEEHKIVSSNIEVPKVNVLTGERNNTLASYIGKWFKKGLSYNDVHDMALKFNQLNCSPPLSDREVESIVKSINKYN